MTIVIFLYKDGLPCYNSRIYGHRTTGKEYLMAKTADTIAIYSRKSRYTGKGESIGNQIDLCREYIRTHYGDAAAEHAVVFEDEGFSLPKRCRNAKRPRRAFGQHCSPVIYSSCHRLPFSTSRKRF
ncbi:MAG: recombinase family protein [Faecalibacterium prausnitzii]